MTIAGDQTIPRQQQRFLVRSGLSGNFADAGAQPVGFLKLINCYPDKRIGAILKRHGSSLEALDAAPTAPARILGISEYVVGAPDSPIPLSTRVIANCGNQWQVRTGSNWDPVSVSNSCSFSTTRLNTMVMHGDRLWIAGGRPAFWAGPGSSIERVGIPAPTQAPTWITSLVGPLDQEARSGWQWMYTYYNENTGLESDWSPLSTTFVGERDSHLISVPTDAGLTNVTHKRIYRTNDGGATPYLVTSIAVASTSVYDDKEDSELTTAAQYFGRNQLPPDSSFIIATYAQRLWMVDAADPSKLAFSLAYTGQPSDLELFPATNYVRTTQPITALLVVPGRMLIFHPRSISYISGTDEDSFSLQPFRTGVGTLFPQSVATNGQNIVCLAEQGFVDVSSDGMHISREIDHDLQPLLAGSYNSQIYSACAWNPSIRQFVFFVNAVSTQYVQWEDANGAAVSWVDGSLNTVNWVTEAGAGTPTNRVKIWGWSPELSGGGRNMWCEYTFPTITDENTSGAYPTTLFHPQPSAELLDPQQDKTFLGFFNGTRGHIRSIFRRDKTQDDSSNITSTLLTNRLSFGSDNGGYKRIFGLQFTGSYGDPTSDGLCTLQYLKDFEDPHLRSFSGSLITIPSNSTDVKNVPQGLARYIHLYLVDTSASQSKVLLSELFIHFRERLRRDNR